MTTLPPKEHNTKVGGFAVDQLKSVVERIEKLSEEKAAIAADISDVYAEARGNGLNCPAIRQIIKLRKKDVQQREEEEAILITYMRALQMDLFEE